MTTEDHATRAEQILSEARKEAMVTTTWTCIMEPRGPFIEKSDRSLDFPGWLIPMLIGWLAAHAFMWFLS